LGRGRGGPLGLGPQQKGFAVKRPPSGAKKRDYLGQIKEKVNHFEKKENLHFFPLKERKRAGFGGGRDKAKPPR